MNRVVVSGVGTEYQVTGQGRPVVLLHGFPDSGRLWRHQVPALAGAGFQVIVPDLRGYGRSDKPGAVEAYSMSLLAGDVAAILADLEIGRAHIVGHDWGAALAWALAALAPGRVDHLVVLSVGHPAHEADQDAARSRRPRPARATLAREAPADHAHGRGSQIDPAEVVEEGE